MNKLLNLKKWLTVPEAAQHLALVLEERVTESDVLRLALDGHLKMSVNFVNHAYAKLGEVVPLEKVDMAQGFLREGEEPYLVPLAFQLNDHDFLKLEKKIVTLEGVYDLPLVGIEKLVLENEYQKLVGGPSVTRHCLDGAFVKNQDDQWFQLQEGFDDKAGQVGSQEYLVELKDWIARENIGPLEQMQLLEQHIAASRNLLDERLAQLKSGKDLRIYRSAQGLPSDSVLVVRTESLMDFEAGLNDSATTLEVSAVAPNLGHVSDRLKTLNQAAIKFWANANRDDRGTHPTNDMVIAWLEQENFSQSLAEKGATIIRPEWVPTGRKPEE